VSLLSYSIFDRQIPGGFMRTSSFSLAIAIAAVVLMGGAVVLVLVNRSQPAVTVTSPGARSESSGGDVKIDAPYTKIEKNEKGTNIQAPGVSIQLPPKPKD
jgi:hypothetical protein